VCKQRLGRMGEDEGGWACAERRMRVNRVAEAAVSAGHVEVWCSGLVKFHVSRVNVLKLQLM
jgi:hypothetical protein